ncbi:hypothetical protein Q8F55_009102 [Vanrija albida]|uniref:BTB domain-containing protein n=1 Tax=Vanrija albida TaxID=181172 RepID=A0ABR3PSW3_9TREE
MPNLHAHYYHGNVKAFRQELDGTATHALPSQAGAGSSSNANGATGKSLNPGSASGGRSWSAGGFTCPPVKADPNERDALGRTTLHLAASTLTPQAYTFFTILLRSPNLSVNLQDYESGYTALHRALYAGNIRAARDLLARSDTDISIKDGEGLTAFDLYNGTVDGTNPPTNVDGTDLYVWGVNRNFALGTGDSTDKAFPDRINLLTQRQASDNPDPTQRFFHVGIKEAKMARLHTAVVTSEARGNLSLSGFGSGGRLGRSVHSQLSLLPLPDLQHSIVATALGQDHTLALTSGGYILSWGNNRFAQLGYAIEAPEVPNPFAKEGDELVQAQPKRIVGPLKKEWVRGVAAGRMSSACWTADAVWTWGTNLGHLGYEKAANPVQVNPRKVTAISQPVIDVALSDFAMLCLLDSFEVLCFHHDTNFKINFGGPQRSLKAPKNPGQVTLDPDICKVTSCGQTFATLSKKGDVCTFQLPHPSEEATKDARDRYVTVKPQIQWALRKNFTAVRDLALGSDGTLIVSTASGHVFVRQRVKAGSGLKFKRVPYLQRITKVACNESGAFAAVRVDAKPTPIEYKGKTLEEDLFLLQPHFRRFEHQMTDEDFERHQTAAKPTDDDEDDGYNSVAQDITMAISMCQILERWQRTSGDSLFAWGQPLLGSDVKLVVGEYAIPAHSVLLCLRTPVFARALSGGQVDGITLGKDQTGATLELDACHPLVALLLLQFIYSDSIAAVWDSRVAHILQDKFKGLKLPIGEIKADLRRFADGLELAPLAPVLQLLSKAPIAQKTLAPDLATFFEQTSAPPSDLCDVIVSLADRNVACQSVLLRARCPFFESMFADGEWAFERDENGKAVIDMPHLRWRPMNLVFKFIHEGVEDDLFDYLHQETLDEFLDFVFEVMAAATELLMDRLILVCSRVIARHCNPYNAAALAVEASFYQATTLKLSIFDYIIASMETMLESGLLDDMDEDVMKDLCGVIAAKQRDKALVPRTGLLVDDLMAKHREWLAVQDIPTPRIRVPQRWKPKSPRISPADTTSMSQIHRRPPKSPLGTPDLKPLQPSTAVDDIFIMDDEPVLSSSPALGPSPGARGAATPNTRPITPLNLPSSSAGGSKGAVWKSRTVESEKVDLRSIMAEAAATKRPAVPTTPASKLGSSPSLGSSPRMTPAGPPRASTPGSSGSPWRPIDARRASLTGIQGQQAASPAASSALARAPGSQASPAPQRNLIAPVKMQAATATATTRRAAGGAAWATPTTYAAPQPTVGAPSTSPAASSLPAFSLLAIQQEERLAAEKTTARAPKSFTQILKEESASKAAAKEEENFLRWWQEEEARQKAASGVSGSQQGAAAANSSRGRGRGGQQQTRVAKRGGRGGASDAPANGDNPDARDAARAAGTGGRGRGRGGKQGGRDSNGSNGAEEGAPKANGNGGPKANGNGSAPAPKPANGSGNPASGAANGRTPGEARKPRGQRGSGGRGGGKEAKDDKAKVTA